MSSQLNTLAGTIYQDFVKSHMPADITEKTISNIMKLIVVIVGLLSLGLVFVVEKLGGVVEVSLSLHGITAGPLLGLFTLGMLFPFANAKVTNRSSKIREIKILTVSGSAVRRHCFNAMRNNFSCRNSAIILSWYHKERKKTSFN